MHFHEKFRTLFQLIDSALNVMLWGCCHLWRIWKTSGCLLIYATTSSTGPITSGSQLYSLLSFHTSIKTSGPLMNFSSRYFTTWLGLQHPGECFRLCDLLIPVTTTTSPLGMETDRQSRGISCIWSRKDNINWKSDMITESVVDLFTYISQNIWLTELSPNQILSHAS